VEASRSQPADAPADRGDAGGPRREGPADRPWWLALLGVALLTATVVVAGVHWRGDPAPHAGHARRVPAAGTVPDVAVRSSAASTPAPAAIGTRVVFSFDGGLAALHSAAADQPALTLRSAQGGQLTGVPHGSGTALEFPAPCAQYGAPQCPRVVLEAPGAGLNPGGHSLRWGATVQLVADRTTPGSNIVQKGYAARAGGQFKLQVDGDAGAPSCVLVDAAPGSPVHIAKASASIADGRWHTVACTRAGTSLSVSIDGIQRGVTSVPAGLSVDNEDTLRIGGKGTSPNNDQFSGALDDVFVDIGS
jgi:Concanavalin A-like lectin/glucanases superfamily